MMSNQISTHNNVAQNGYTAVVYFHGMGSQRRFEETSRLIDSVDKYLSNSYRKRSEELGMLTKIKPKAESHFQDNDKIVTFIRTRYSPIKAPPPPEPAEARFYEVYWAPVMAGSKSARRVFWWILRQSIRPFQTLRTPWRERQRIRRSALVDLMEHPDKWPEDTHEEDFNKLVWNYANFDKLSAKRSYPDGTYKDFKAFLLQKNTNRPETAQRLTELANRWKSNYSRTELKNNFIMMTILLTIISLFGFTLWSTLQVLNLISELPFITSENSAVSLFLKDKLDPEISTGLSLTLSFFLSIGLGKFLSDYMGDVEAWSTFEETDEKHEKRQRIIDHGIDTLSHVLHDDRCKRVVVVSHSLGTSVAHDTVLAVARQNTAVNSQDPISGPVKLDKIRHFVTIASPIDKINYFFESFRSKFHRYVRVVEELRGDIGKAPFSRNTKPHVHWINFWDEADLISGALHSPSNRSNLAHRVDNVHISNLLFPAPGASHSAYFENQTVISNIFEIIYRGTLNYETLPLIPGQGYDYDIVSLAPGDKRGRVRLFHLGAIAIPWGGLVCGILFLFGLNQIAVAGLLGLTGLAVVMSLSWLISSGRGNRSPL